MKPSRTAKRHARMEKFKQGGATSMDTGASRLCVTREEIRDGRGILVACFARSGDMPSHTIPLTGLDPNHSSAPMLRDAYVNSAVRLRTIQSRRSMWSLFKNGLLRFLAEHEITDAVIDDVFLARFANWLTALGMGERPLGLRSRREYYRTAVSILKTGADAGIHGLKDAQVDWRADPWAGQQVGPPPPSAFQSVEEMTLILRTCRTKVEATMETIMPYLDAIDRGPSDDPVVTEAARVRALLLQHAGSGQFDLSKAFASISDAKLRNAAARALMPLLSDLIPFALLMAHYTGFNQSTLLTMRIDGIRRRTVGSTSHTIVESYKARSAAMQRATFAVDDSSTNPDRLLDFIERWTALLRELSGSPHLWLARTGGHVRDFGDPRVTSSLSSFLPSWMSRHQLPATNISAIRKGMIDLAHLASDGDPHAMRTVGGQRSPDVLARHYTSDAARRRERERLASAVQEFERLIGSSGRIDARRLPDTADRSAATPGFICLDRHASPIPGEIPGRSCRAYGHCPICPLAAVDVSSPRSCGYLHLLLERIESGLEGNGAASAASYVGTWLPIARQLRTRWLSKFNDETRNAAKQLDLVALPEIE